MKHNGGNSISDQESRAFSLEKAFLTRKNYKVIFCMTFILAALRTALFIPLLLGWKLTGWEADVAAVLFFILLFILDLIFILIPIVFVVRIIFTYLLKKRLLSWSKQFGSG
ncbi:hypothetical protein [Bartonella gabonensis]|uniref:hypothetical protein n=1 Tax=Bartonella gabonensis TaxID=2699889 RepID=UPI001FEC4764|nr:hypothetical protein [Bartonella gabonensis]